MHEEGECETRVVCHLFLSPWILLRYSANYQVASSEPHITMLISEMVCRKIHHCLIKVKALHLAQQICAIRSGWEFVIGVHLLCACPILALFHRLYQRGDIRFDQASGGLMLCSCSYVSSFSENFISDRASVGVFSAKNRLSWVCCYAELLIYPQLLCGLKFRVLFINHVPQMWSTLFIVKHGNT